MIRGRLFGEMIRVSAQKSELQPRNRSYRPKVRDTAGQTPESEPNRSEKVAEPGLKRRDGILRKFLCPEFSPFSPDFWAVSVLNCTKDLHGEDAKNLLEKIQMAS